MGAKDVILHWPQLVYLALMIIGVGVSLANHGKGRAGTYNLFSALIANAITLTLLYFGGFFGHHVCS